MGRFTVLGIDQESYGLAVVKSCDGFSWSESVSLDGTELPVGSATFDEYEDAAAIADRAIVMDRHYWPPINPVMAEVEGNRITKLLASGEPTPEDIAAAGERWHIPVEVVP